MIITIITPIKFPNKSGHWKLLSGTKRWRNSKIIESEIKYILNTLNSFTFLKVKKPTAERNKKIYKWFDEIKKSGVICGCFFMSLYKKYPNILPGNKYRKINTKFNK